MDNSQQKNNDDARAAGKDPQATPDPAVQARDDSSTPREKKRPAEIVRSAERTADAMSPPTPVMATHGPMQPVLSAADIVVLVLRYKWTILAVFILVAAPAIAAIWTLVVPQYQARAEVRVRPIIPYLVFRTEDSGAIPLYASYVNTQVAIISGASVLQRALDQQEVQQTQWYKNPAKSFVQRLGGSPPAPRDRLRDALSARPRKETEIIDITFTDRSPSDAKVILDTVLYQYGKYIGEMSDATQDTLYKQLEDQYRSLENEILGRETITAELRQRLGTATPEELVAGRRVRLDEAEARLAEMRQSIVLLEWEIARREPNDSNEPPAAEAIQKQLRYYEDAEWRRLDGNMRNLRHAIDTSLLTDSNPDAIRAKKDLAFAEEMLRLRETQLDEQWLDRRENAAGLSTAYTAAASPGYQEDLLSLKHRLDRANYEERLLDEEFKVRHKDFNDLFSSAQLLEKENTTLQHKRELFDAVRQRLDQKNMERNVPGSIEVFAEAVVSSKPYNDRRIVLTAMALVLALGLGGVVAFLTDSRNKAIHTPGDLPYPMQVPFLGCIPDIGGPKSSNGQAGHALIESTRVVRTALLSRLDGQACPERSRGNGTTILVTSAAAGTGKSSFTLMLGRSLAQAGKKVLLIDADFRKMALTSHFKNLSDQSGFIQSLRRGTVYKRHIFQTETSGLSIVPAGKKGDDREVLDEIANGAFQTCIDRLRKQYDMILLDSPAILPLADAAILSSQVDGTIMVERELVSRRADVIGALARLGSAGGRLLGTVFIGSGTHEEY